MAERFKFFISYRKADATAKFTTGGLNDELEKHFAGTVFLDRKEIQPGVDWASKIDRALQDSHLLIVLIGDRTRWLHSLNSALEGKEDWVRKEIRIAIDREIPILPVYRQPEGEPIEDSDLPHDLAHFCDWQAFVLEGTEKPSLAEFVRAVAHAAPEGRGGPGPSPHRLLEIINDLDEHSCTPSNPARQAPRDAGLEKESLSSDLTGSLSGALRSGEPICRDGPEKGSHVRVVSFSTVKNR